MLAWFERTRNLRLRFGGVLSGFGLVFGLVFRTRLGARFAAGLTIAILVGGKSRH